MKPVTSLMKQKMLFPFAFLAFINFEGHYVQAQTSVVQSFDGSNANTATELGYEGNPTIRVGNSRGGTNVGAPYFAPIANANNNISSWGITGTTESLLFRGRQTAVGSTGNYIQFRLAAWGLVSDEGLDGDDQVNVFVSVDNGISYNNTLRITGKRNGQGNGYWYYSQPTNQSPAQSPPGPQATVNYLSSANPTILGPSTGGNENRNDEGYDKFRINLPAGAQNVRFYIVANCNANELWTIDEVTLGSSSSAPLPVELKSFTASATTAGTQLQWATASEENNAAFEVQHGTTAEKFETIGRVKGQGTSSHGHRYEWVDARPLAGVNYYRLRQLDYDGTEAFSPVVVVQSKEALASAVFPNPTTGFVTLPASLGAVRYRVLNNLGQTMLSGEATGGNTMDVQSLREGTYFLEVNSLTGRSVQRFVKSL